MRLFIALEPDEGFRQALAGLQEALLAAGVTGRALESAFLHMTLAFIGEWEDPRAAEAALPRAGTPFPLTLDRLGLFPGAKVLWAGVEESAALSALAERVRTSLSGAGIPYDKKPFVPHITLLRKPVLPEGMLLSGVRVPRVSMTVRDVCLYRSERGARGMEYTPLARGPR